MTEVIIGIVTALIMALSGFILGKKTERKHTAVRDSDIEEGLKYKTYGLTQDSAEIRRQFKHNSELITKKLKEAPNEKIIDMFNAAFSTPHPHGTRTTTEPRRSRSDSL